MPVIAITRLHLRSDEYSDDFWSTTTLIIEQAKQADGHLASNFEIDAEGGAWTKTSWQNAAAMRAFIVDTPHVDAMAKLRQWCDEAMFTNFDSDTADLPSWQIAHHHLVAKPTVSTVLYPSDRQTPRSFDDVPVPGPPPS